MCVMCRRKIRRPLRPWGRLYWRHLGFHWGSTTQTFGHTGRGNADSWVDTARQVDYMVERFGHGMGTVKGVADSLKLSKFYSLCPPECSHFVQLQKLRSTVAVANLVHEFLKTQDRERFQRHRDSLTAGKPTVEKKINSQMVRPQRIMEIIMLQELGTLGRPPTCYGCGKKGHKISEKV